MSMHNQKENKNDFKLKIIGTHTHIHIHTTQMWLLGHRKSVTCGQVASSSLRENPESALCPQLQGVGTARGRDRYRKRRLCTVLNHSSHSL